MGVGYPINFEVSEDSPIFTHPLYVKWSTKNFETISGEQGDLITDLIAIQPNAQTAELIAFLSAIFRLSILINTA